MGIYSAFSAAQSGLQLGRSVEHIKKKPHTQSERKINDNSTLISTPVTQKSDTHARTHTRTHAHTLPELEEKQNKNKTGAITVQHTI